MTNKTVWVVEKGSYSDYTVVGVFTSKEYAQQIADAINKPDDEDAYHGDEATIAEWPLNPAVKELRNGLTQYLIHMLEDGTVERAVKQDFSYYALADSVQIWRRSTAPAYAGRDAKDVLSATVWAKDEKHAIKIANEYRVRMIANGEWANTK